MPRLCDRGFIQGHLEYTHNQQSPQCFHIWVALGIIAATLGRRVWMESSGSATEEGYYKLYPNLYVILVSPSGVGMKGTALNLGIELLDASAVPVDVLRGKISSTRLITRLAGSAIANADHNAEMLIFSQEFKVFTKGVMRDSSLIEDLTDLYDNKTFDYETEHSVRQQIKHPCINILGGSTPEWLSGGSAGDIMSGGFGARILPISVTQEEKEIAWATKTKSEKALQEKLIHDLVDIGTLTGQFYVTQAAHDFFETWYMRRKSLRTLLDSRLDGYFSKKHDKILRLSMILSASQSSEMAVDVSHIQAALALLEENEKHLLFAYGGAAANVEARYRDQVLAKIEEKGEVSHTDLAQYFYHGLGRKGLREVIFGLCEEKVIEAFTVTTKSRPKLMYRFCKEEVEEK